MGLDDVAEFLKLCPRCNSCKYTYRQYLPSCPAFEKFQWETYTSNGKIWLARDLQAGIVPWSESVVQKIFSCTLCGSCAEQCQQEAGAHNQDIFEALREEAVERGLGPLAAHKKIKENIDAVDNPYGEEKVARFAGVPDKYFRAGADVGYFIGCTSALREKSLRDATLQVLDKLGVNFTLFRDETCCGSPLLTTGQKNAARRLAEHTIEMIKKSGVKQVVVSCAGCYRTLKVAYPKKYNLEVPVPVLHITEYLATALKKAQWKPGARKDLLTVTYHDPCHLGRHAEVYDAPREVLKLIPGVKLVEMERNRANAWCCGAGAGVKSQFKDWAIEIAQERIKEARGTGAEIIVSACPFCERNFKDACAGVQGGLMPVKDVVELVSERLA